MKKRETGELQEKEASRKKNRGRINRLFCKISDYFRSGSIRRQLYKVYILAGVIPITLIGGFLLVNTYHLFIDYSRDLLESYNQRVSTTFFEITTQTYNISNKLAYDEDLWNALSTDYLSEDLEEASVDSLRVIDDYNYDYTAIDSIEIYCDNPTIKNYEQFYQASDDIVKSDWYQQAITQSSAFWQSLTRKDTYGNSYYNICLVRQIPLVNSDYTAVLLVRLSDNYLKMRLSETQYTSAVSVGEQAVAYSSDQTLYGTAMTDLMPVTLGDSYYKYTGMKDMPKGKSLVYGAALQPYHSDSQFLICTMNDDIYGQIRTMLLVCILILIIALAIPIIIIHLFSGYFSGRIETLRGAMHKVSEGEYNIPEALSGDDEVSEAFSDLVVTSRQIEMQKEAMYKGQIREKELQRRQQETEFKVLAGQINPHFLYNTLETIRMKAFKANDREVAGAIKTLGKILRYVLDNTGTKQTTLAGALDYISNYLSIQKLRFGDRVNYEINVAEEIDPKSTYMLPLLVQPIIENAIIHGLDEKEENGLVRVDIFRRHVAAPEHEAADADMEGTEIKYEAQHSIPALIIQIYDNGCGMTKEEIDALMEKMAHPQEGGKRSIGLANVYQRVKLSYGKPYDMQITSMGKETGTTVTLILPFTTALNNNTEEI